jgi:hypothetical protein
MADAFEDAMPLSEPPSEEYIQWSIHYLSDRLDPARCYWLDKAIREICGKPIRG